jgi:uncharacterized protein
MWWAAWCIDSEGASEKRKKYYKKHSAHLGACPMRLVISGPLTADNAVSSVGSLLMFEASTRKAVEDFVASDPFAQNGVWKSVEIRAFRRSR